MNIFLFIKCLFEGRKEEKRTQNLIKEIGLYKYLKEEIPKLEEVAEIRWMK